MSEADTILEVAELAEIIKFLPHRYPFLLIDRVVGMHADERGIGIKNVTVNEPQFQGHFPGNPVFPGVLMIEGMAQTAGVMCLRFVGASENKTKLVYFLTIDNCKFRRPVVPGETIEYHMTKKTRRKQMWWFHGIAKVNGQVAAEADVGAMIAEAD